MPVIANWIKTVLKDVSIDISFFTTHSYRSASISKTPLMGLRFEGILERGDSAKNLSPDMGITINSFSVGSRTIRIKYSLKNVYKVRASKVQSTVVKVSL